MSLSLRMRGVTSLVLNGLVVYFKETQMVITNSAKSLLAAFSTSAAAKARSACEPVISVQQTIAA